MLDKDILILKSTWRNISVIKEVEFHVKSLMVAAFAAVGEEISSYCVSGKRGPKAVQESPKRKIPNQMVEIAKGNFL